MDNDSEHAAAATALHGGPLARARVALSALFALMRNPEDTSRVFVIGIAANRGHYPAFLARLTADDDGARLLRERPVIDSRHVDLAALRALPADTLGGAYARFLDANGLDPDVFQPPPGLPDVPAYVNQRMRQVHDVWHVLTGYDTDVAGEVALQAFAFANVGNPSSGLIALGGLLRFGLLAEVVEGYRRGRRAAFLPPVWFEERWTRRLADVRAELRV